MESFAEQSEVVKQSLESRGQGFQSCQKTSGLGIGGLPDEFWRDVMGVVFAPKESWRSLAENVRGRVV